MLVRIGESNLSPEETYAVIFTRGWTAVDTDNMAYLTRTAGNTRYGLPKYILILPVPKPETFREVIEYKRDDYVRSIIRAWTLDEALQIADKRMPKLIERRSRLSPKAAG